MRVLFAGTPDVAVPALRYIAQHHDVAGVLTRPDARGKRGRTLYPSPVAEVAEELQLPLHKTTKLTTPQAQAFIAEAQADVAAVVAYGALIPAELLEALPSGWVNLHFSLLPAYRGAAPVQRMIAAGERDFGVSVFRIDTGLDTGALVDQRRIELPARVTSGQALEILARESAPYFAQTLAAYVAGQCTLQAQPTTGASYAQRLTPPEGEVNFDQPLAQVDAHIRAFTPSPGAWTTAGDQRLKILAAHPHHSDRNMAVGQVDLDDDTVVVGCSDGLLALSEVAPAGKKPMAAHAWWRGYRGPRQLGTSA
ncbi:MAG: methionyl-tRNA formyltransferase [Bowdeniella nasicola]|nr:methionyl-tRNA formyltransferase [Bowdeniella nasicola]